MSGDVFYKKDPKTGIIEKSIHEIGKMEYRCAVNFKQFYNDFYEYLMKNREIQFKDSMGTSSNKKIGKFFDYQNKEGEFVDDKANLNRHGDMYEKKFTWAKNDGSVEFEMVWEAKAKTPHSAFGWFDFKLELVNRTIIDIDVEKNGKKEKRQNGTWEFRTDIIYKNNIIPEYLNSIPFVKNSESLQDLYLKNIYYKTLEEDYKWCVEKIEKPYIAFVESYFGPNSTK